MPSYLLEKHIYHAGLGKQRVVKAPTHSLLEQMAAVQMAQWEDQYRRKIDVQQRANQRKAAAQQKEEMKAEAARLTAEAQEAVERVSTILKATLSVNDAIAWQSLMDRAPFVVPIPVLKAMPPPQPEPVPLPPTSGRPEYQPVFTLVDRLSSKKKQEKVAEAEARFQHDFQLWRQHKANIEARNAKAVADHKAAIELAQATHVKSMNQHEQMRLDFLVAQQQKNKGVQELATAYHAKDRQAVLTYCELVLSRSSYPDEFPQEFDLDFDPGSGIVAVEYRLPAPENMPSVKEVKYVQSRDSLEEVALSQSALNGLYDSALYQIALRTIHELLEADAAGAITAVCFNGWVKTTNAATGKEVDACILSVLAQKGEFEAIDLAKVDPKACFKSLKGIGSAKLHALAPVPPVLQLNREDKRFVGSYAVVQDLDEGTNLAAIPWEDFEHLVREVFEKEFSVSGGEVKVTQASRDGGVDAVAFDPDPIRGGKTVIQAKRYTATVGVSAVRDLYGTVMNEGANKGILVTTSDYGPDAYQFAKDKPLVLLNGGNLLSLMERHGHKARIDLVEARRQNIGA